ncbi:MAG: hypothetical protein GX781_07420, partial [Clostridiales bacterium]|nr:hypothetical protein [Clostridiales bacterium]
MTKEDKLILDQFQCEYNRVLEEEFAQLIAERNDLNLFFINENQAFTDGRNIIIDPAWNGLFADEQALKDTERFLMLDNTISGDRWLALRMSARAQNIHEALHIIYSNFPCAAFEDIRATCKARCVVLSLISNIIEDAFIEAAGCSEYDNMERFLLWHRVALYFSNTPSQGTVQRALAETPCQTEEDQSKTEAIVRYLNYMCIFLLYPMAQQDPPDDDIEPYVTQTKHLFQEGAMCGNADKRYSYVQKIFDLVDPIVPQGEDVEIQTELLAHMLSGSKTHSPLASSIIEWESTGKTIQVKRNLFKDEKGDSISFDELKQQLADDIKVFSSQKYAALNILAYKGSSTNFIGIDFDCDLIHKGISIQVQKPRINLNMKTAYQNILNNYSLSISSYNARFSQLLKGTVDVKEDRLLFGSSIVSKHLGDVKKRYWSRSN